MSVSRYTSYNLLGSALPIVLALVTVPAYLKLVGPDRYGVLAIAWLLLGYFGLFDLGLGRATSFRVSALKHALPQERADTFWAALSLNLGMGIVGGCVLWAVSWGFFEHIFKVGHDLRAEILRAVPLLAAAVPIATITGVLTGALQGRERFLQINLISVLSTALFQLAPLGVAWRFEPDLFWLLASAVLARTAALGVLAAICCAEFVVGQKIRVLKREMPLLLRYGGWVMVSSIFGPVLVVVDRFAIGALLGAQAVTAYTVPFQLAQRIQILPAALTNSLFPRMSSASDADRRVMFHRATLVLASLLTFPTLCAIYILDPFLHIWIGATLAGDSVPVARILVLGFWTNAFALVVFMRLQSGGRPDLVSKILLCEIPPYLIGLYVGMSMWGLVGCAVVFGIRCVADYILLNVAAGRDFRALPTISVNLLLLLIGSWAATVSPPWTLVWWSTAFVLGGLTLAFAWRTLPEEGRVFVRRWAPFRRRGASA